MFKRKILSQLLKWKNEGSPKPLILRGARQVGKSTLAKELGSHFSSYIELNLEKSADAGFFKDSDDVKEILERILLEKNIEFVADNTLLFIDEIQEVPACIALLRYFYEELPGLHVIAAGSLLEFAISDVPSFPVGRVEQLPVYPMDFEEFLEALAEKKALQYYRQAPMPQLAHDRLLTLFNTYIMIGGMPEVIATYVSQDRRISALGKVYSSIWDNYVRDIEKYGDTTKERKVLRHIIETAPAVRDRITFNGFGNSNYKSREVGEAFRKLDKAGIIRLIYPTSETSPPIRPNYKRKPKIQFLDTGLLNYASGIQAEMLGTHDLNSLYKGYISNHMIVQELIAASPKLGYVPAFWTRENANANAEVDIVLQHGAQLIPVEVKSGAKGRLRSLHEYMDRCEHNTAVRLLANHISVEEAKTRTGKQFSLVNLPYYLAGNIRAHIDEVVAN